MRTSKPVTVTLGDMAERVDALRVSGRYASTSEVLRAGVRALEREQAALDAYMREEVRKALDDTRPSVPSEDVFARLKRRHQEEAKAAGRGV
ncbi:type II toxin-antitoxin system ParD family antitoxin (plasmid) [Xanthobacter dioxanivorans]|uniref:Type II toxin-antitoxin system ParD family antitoxin n=1 Tax=Xanthobacter dioxanivorans TaxID=2528964 RepID=A0A974PUY2_9HYPH|nr:type II toxin-antitoxin system ParD family antitoxin [Xanthobacter dioxanivorans]QRG10288.1 type II toxin-antitoxin system ParD family antitoxin [Xanthobacter dioxanivorans]QRG10305.1 type II toxin-antitoxin system ParD family antitoxin [Xanthobacter dioxanivorans]